MQTTAARQEQFATQNKFFQRILPCTICEERSRVCQMFGIIMSPAKLGFARDSAN